MWTGEVISSKHLKLW